MYIYKKQTNKQTNNMNFFQDILKPLASIPIELVGVGTTMLPVPGLRNISQDAVQWANPSAYEHQKELEHNISIRRIGSTDNAWTWILFIIIGYIAYTNINQKK